MVQVLIETKVTEVKVLACENSKREPIAIAPPAVRVAVARVEPAAPAIAIRAEQARTAAGVLNVLMHDNDSPEAHLFDLLVGEHDADETCDFWIRGNVLPFGGFRADVPRDAVVVREERTLHDNDLGGDSLGRLEVGRQEDLPRVVADVVAALFQTLDPVGTRAAIGRDREADDPIFFAIRTNDFGKRQFVTQKATSTFHSAELIENRLDAHVFDVEVVLGHENLLPADSRLIHVC